MITRNEQPFSIMKKFTVKLVRLSDITDTKTVTVEAEGAVQACSIAERDNEGYFGTDSNLVEE